MNSTYLRIIFFILLFFGDRCFSQWRSFEKESEWLQVDYDLFADTIQKRYLQQTPLYSAPYGVEQEFMVDLLQIPCSDFCEKFSDAQKHRIKNIFFKKFENVIEFSSKTIISLALYQKNIEEYSIAFYDLTTDQWYLTDESFLFEGFQLPKQISIFKSVDRETKSSFLTDRMIIVPIIKDMDQASIFYASEIIIGETATRKKYFSHPEIELLINGKSVEPDYTYLNCFSIYESVPEVLFNTDFAAQYIPTTINLDKESYEETDEIQLIDNIMDYVIKNYPFYEQRTLDMESVLQKWNHLDIDENHDLKSYSEKISVFIRETFRDIHFFMETTTPKSNLTDGPIRLYPLNEKIVVAAVLDSIYMDRVPLGSEILKVNSIPIGTLIDSLVKVEPGIPEYSFRTAVSKVLRRPRSENVGIEFRHALTGDIDTVTMDYSRRFSIPRSYMKVQGDFEIADSISYYKISGFSGPVFLHFLNHFTEIQNSKGLILDLRGNGGGETGIGMRLFSTFIDKPSVYSHYETSIVNPRLRTMMVKPNPEIRLPQDFTVVILSDINTACAAEEFILAMKQLPHCYSVASTTTCGSLQSRFAFNLPSGIRISLDCLSGRVHSYANGIIENKGLEPDIWIQPSSVEDLAPYDDLLKAAAEAIIKSY
ncbi:MAG: S41 family peptidase [Rikenellaceae bacterium]|nr:S41 family peptidase [Rikenellaceae bacterium]